MSVEEALAEIEERLPRQFSNGISRRAALDALVREVRCEIPCQRAPWRIIPGATYMLDDCSAHPDDLCITCTARAEREVKI